MQYLKAVVVKEADEYPHQFCTLQVLAGLENLSTLQITEVSTNQRAIHTHSYSGLGWGHTHSSK